MENGPWLVDPIVVPYRLGWDPLHGLYKWLINGGPDPNHVSPSPGMLSPSTLRKWGTKMAVVWNSIR